MGGCGEWGVRGEERGGEGRGEGGRVTNLIGHCDWEPITCEQEGGFGEWNKRKKQKQHFLFFWDFKKRCC